MMLHRRSSLLCRLLVAVLLFNMVAPLALADEPLDNGMVLICTSAGLVQVNLSDSDATDADSSMSNSMQHCVYCKLFDSNSDFIAAQLPYPTPDNVVDLHYRSVNATRAAQHITQQVRLRAPPLFLSNS